MNPTERSESQRGLPKSMFLHMVESMLPDLMSQTSQNGSQPRTFRSTWPTQGFSQSQSQHNFFQGMELDLSLKTYKDLTEDDCVRMISDSIKIILMNTFNDEFRQQCFDLLKVNSSEEAGEQFRTLLAENSQLSQVTSSKFSQKQRTPSLVCNPPWIPVDISSLTNGNNQWLFAPPPPVPGLSSGSSSSQISSTPSTSSTLENCYPLPYYGHGIEKENANSPPDDIDYSFLVDSINEILSEAPAFQATQEPVSVSDNSNGLLSEKEYLNIGEENEHSGQMNGSLDDQSPPGSPSLLQNFGSESSGIVFTHKNTVTFALDDEPSDFESQLQQSNHETRKKCSESSGLESQYTEKSQAPQTSQDKNSQTASTSSQGLTGSLVEGDCSEPIGSQLSQNRIRIPPSQADGFGSRRPFQEIQNTSCLNEISSTPPITRDALIQSLRSMR